jgi:hypothetical protein
MIKIVGLWAAGLWIAGLNLPTLDLKGEPHVFPADLAKDRAVVVVTFSKAASDQAIEWTRKLRENEKALAASIYQIAVLEDVPRFVRSFVISALKRALPKTLHDHFWVATSFSKEWQKQIGGASLDEAHVVLLEDRREITWRFHGVFSEAALRSLVAACAQKNQ